ncbi:MAG: hypothetical protein J6Z43_05625 [Clostridiales bacterium]|nr:hypothetical protein [Clostridiales bacterium]
MEEMWNKAITRENITDFYNATVSMVYPSVYDITKETTRAENAIIKSYQDIYFKRDSVAGEDVIYVFGDILLKNANDIIEMYPLPDNLGFAPRLLDEYTRNSMLEKILSKIDSKSFKVAEFISSDTHTQNPSSLIRKYTDVFPITPLLIFEILIVSVIILLVSWAAIKLPYSNQKLINEDSFYESSSLQEKFMTVMGYYPLNADISRSFINKEKTASADDQTGEDQPVPSSQDTAAPETSETSELAPSTAETTGTEPSATRG